MIAVDSSALMAVVLGEDDAEAYVSAMTSDDHVIIGAATLAEATIVAEARGGSGGRDRLEQLLRAIGAEVVPFDEAAAVVAANSMRRFGRGRHPARLNLGDSCAYATARLAEAPLLFKGGGFAQTDIRSAL